jgi:hypothetical protein
MRAQLSDFAMLTAESDRFMPDEIAGLHAGLVARTRRPLTAGELARQSTVLVPLTAIMGPRLLPSN